MVPGDNYSYFNKFKKPPILIYYTTSPGHYELAYPKEDSPKAKWSDAHAEKILEETIFSQNADPFALCNIFFYLNSQSDLLVNTALNFQFETEKEIKEMIKQEIEQRRKNLRRILAKFKSCLDILGNKFIEELSSKKRDFELAYQVLIRLATDKIVLFEDGDELIALEVGKEGPLSEMWNLWKDIFDSKVVENATGHERRDPSFPSNSDPSSSTAIVAYNPQSVVERSQIQPQASEPPPHVHATIDKLGSAANSTEQKLIEWKGSPCEREEIKQEWLRFFDSRNILQFSRFDISAEALEILFSVLNHKILKIKFFYCRFDDDATRAICEASLRDYPKSIVQIQFFACDFGSGAERLRSNAKNEIQMCKTGEREL